MILVDEERVDLFTGMKGDLAESKIYCWSELKQTGRDIKVSKPESHRLPLVECNRNIESDVFSGSRHSGGLVSKRPESWSRERCCHLLHLWVCLRSSSSANDSTGGRPKAVLSTQRMALSNLWSGFVGEPNTRRSQGQADGSPLPSSFAGRSTITPTSQTE
jgi:hypothetical protein